MIMEEKMNSNDLITNVSKNSNDTAALIWSVADDLVGAYKPHEYGLVILPMTVIKRFHDCLLPTHQAVLDTYKKVEKLAVKDGFLKKASGYQFYNTSPFTFKTLLADPENIVDNFKAYLNGFSDNVQDILARMDFDSQIKHMSEAGLLYQVISDFCTDRGDFSPEKISAVDMGYVFENLVRRFSESYNEEAGAHFTSRDIIYLMSDLLVAGDDYAFTGDGISKTVYDMTMGTSQMLTCMEERLKQMDADADVTVFGQEFNPFTFGIAKRICLFVVVTPIICSLVILYLMINSVGISSIILSAIHLLEFLGNVKKKKLKRSLRKVQQGDSHLDYRQKVMDSFCSC